MSILESVNNLKNHLMSEYFTLAKVVEFIDNPDYYDHMQVREMVTSRMDKIALFIGDDK